MKDEEIEKMANDYAVPIEGAWKDGTPIAREAYQAYIDGFNKAREMYEQKWVKRAAKPCQIPKKSLVYDGGSVMALSEYPLDDTSYITHFMPLPEPPKDKSLNE